MAHRADPTARFSHRVDDYLRARPGYPAELVRQLVNEMGLDSDCTVADVGSGTGLFARELLALGLKVYGVEPNQAMREAADGLPEPFVNVDGRAEATGLDDQSVQAIFVAQAFHWFEREPTLREFRRVLTSPKRLALIWNQRRTEGSAFACEYEALLQRYGIGYEQIKQGWLDTDGVFADSPNGLLLPNLQLHDWPGLKARLFSSSYAPPADHENYAPLVEALQALFDREQRDGEVAMAYDCRAFFGEIGD